MTSALPWDPEMESPATVLIIGGGPVGIETAIYARFLGYFVSIFESRRVGHRMLDWHDRPLALPVAQVTTPLGHAAIAAQNPEYQRPDPDRIFTGREYAEEYLIPLAKTDLLFDDIHFLSPIEDASRIRTHRRDPIHLQDRCNDEFRILVQGQHRGPWIARGDCVIDCRGHSIEPIGMGPGGGLAIGEREHEQEFLLHAPGDRKHEPKQLKGKHLGLIGQDAMACQCVEDWLQRFLPESESRLTWMVRPRGAHDSPRYSRLRDSIEAASPRHLVCLETLGVESISMQENGRFRWKLLKEDDSTVDLETDLAMRRTDYRYRSIGNELHAHADQWMGFRLNSGDAQNSGECPGFVTAEPGYYAIRAGSMHCRSVENGAGIGLPEAFEGIRQVFALIGGREDLDLYKIIQQQSPSS